MKKVNKKEAKKIAKISSYNEDHSKTVIENMFYKDNSPACILVVCKNSDSVMEYMNQLSKYKCETNQSDSGLFRVKLGTKYHDTIFAIESDIDRIADYVKVADGVVIDVKDELDIEVLEVHSMVNAIGSVRVFYSSLETGKNRNTIKKIKSDTGRRCRILSMGQLITQLSRFKIRPVEFKCSRSYLIAESVDKNVIRGQLRGKPLLCETGDGILAVESGKMLQISRIEKVDGGIRYKEAARQKSETDEIGENFLMESKRENQANFEIKNEILKERGYLIPGDLIEVEVVGDMDQSLIYALDTGRMKIGQYSGTVTPNKHYHPSMKQLNNLINSDIVINIGWYKIRSSGMRLSNNGILTDTITKYDTSINLSTEYQLHDANYFAYTKSPDHFRILFSGRFTKNDGDLYHSYNLVGYPRQIGINHVVVTRMFKNKAECTKFIGAKLVTSSGIRGIAKGAIGQGGEFRAKFEGNILESDIILLGVKERVTGVEEEINQKNEGDSKIECTRINTGDSYLSRLKKKAEQVKEKEKKSRLDEIEEMLETDQVDQKVVHETVDKTVSESRRRVCALKHIKESKKGRMGFKRKSKHRA